MTRLLIAGLLLLTSAAGLPADYKPPFACKEEDLLWAGMSCSDREPCAIYLDIASVGTVQNQIFAIGSIHSAQTTLFSVLLVSDDEGATWREPLERVRGEELNQIQFLNSGVGWIGGGRVVPLPGDPFVEYTRDGGKTWTKRSLLPEGTAGSIPAFHFSSAQNGQAIVDHGARHGDGNPRDLRYQLFETVDGGETWMARESSRVPIKNAPVQSSDPAWRIRAEAGGKSFALEHLVAEKWVAQTTFPIRIAECKGEGLE